ncbi:MAG: NAD-dependent epimerase/dehydratase family protein, partial [Rhodospirillales bacterium]
MPATGPILITGASGYLGAKVVTLARSVGLSVVATARRAGLAIDYPCDLVDSDAVVRLLAAVQPRTILHGAAAVPRTTS